MELSALYRHLIVRVLLWQHLLILQWLHSGMVMVLMSLTVNSLRDVLMTGGLHGLAGDSRIDVLINCRGMTMTAGELGNGFLCRFHDV